MTARASRVTDRRDPRLEAAQKRLRESIGQGETLEAVREIVTNLLGCEEIGLFTLEGNSELFWSFGIDPKRHGSLDAFEESGLREALRGEFHVVRDVCEEQDGRTKPVRVFVPIRAGGRIVAVLVMVKLLPQKIDFDEADIKLAKVLSDEVGRALFSSGANADA